MTGEAQRLTEVLQTTSGDVLTYFRRRVAPEDAADLLAQTAEVAWRRIDSLPHGVDEARPWLFGVARHVLLNHQRGARRRTALADRVRDVLVRAPAVAPPADAGVEVRDAIERLPDDLAEVVRLIHWEGLSVTEVAVVTGVSASTARARYAAARARLHDTLAAHARH